MKKKVDRKDSNSLQSELMLEITKQITSTLNFEEVLESVVDSLSQLYSFDAAGIFLVDKKGGTLRHMVTRGYNKKILDKMPIKIHEGISGHVVKVKKGIIIPDVSKDPNYYMVRPETKSQMTVPLFSGDDVTGVLVLESDQLNHFSKVDLEMLTAFASFAAIAIDNAELYKDSLTKKHLESELLVASKIQKALLPERPPNIPEIQIDATNIPSLIVGGDMYDMFYQDKNSLGVAIGDVSGKGAPGAILMAVLYAGFKSLLKEVFQVSEVMAHLNNLLEEATTSGYFATFWFGVIDVESNFLTYCNAGHNAPILLRKNKEFEFLEKGGMLLGYLPYQDYVQDRIPFNSGDYLVLYTDGITEIKNEAEKEFGEKRLVSVLKRNYGKSPTEMKNEILKAVKDFSGTTEFDDDITLIIIYKE
jgi:sigma-B regulation protein RsbU (phosphoserine phosphatase)